MLGLCVFLKFPRFFLYCSIVFLNSKHRMARYSFIHLFMWQPTLTRIPQPYELSEKILTHTATLAEMETWIIRIVHFYLSDPKDVLTLTCYFDQVYTGLYHAIYCQRVKIPLGLRKSIELLSTPQWAIYAQRLINHYEKNGSFCGRVR